MKPKKIFINLFIQIQAFSKSMYICLSYNMHKCDIFHSSYDKGQYYTNLRNVIKLLGSEMLFINCDVPPTLITGNRPALITSCSQDTSFFS